MIKYIIKRIIILIPVVIAIAILLFAINKLMPGDPIRAMIPTNLKPAQKQVMYLALSERFGTNKPVVEQYFRWIINLVVHRDLGYSTMYNRPVVQAVTEPLLNTVILNVGINILYLLIALPVGIKMATKRGSLVDNGFQVFSLITYSLPSFFLALSLIFFFGVTLGWLPLGGMPNATLYQGGDLLFQWLRHLVMPVITLTIISLAGAIRYVRNAMIDALNQDYIRTARSKGLNEKVVIYSHAFRNALIPISTVIVGTIFSLFAGAAITESVFAYNGIGRMIVAAVNQRDTNMIVTMNLFFSVVSVVSVLVSDIIYGLIDPRIKLS
jgi:peptide/nickel transport system permease protein